jgi:hypothetical protein
MASAREQAADEFMQKWFKRPHSKAVNNSVGSPMKVNDSVDTDVEALSASPIDTTEHECNSDCNSDCEQNKGDYEDEDEDDSGDEESEGDASDGTSSPDFDDSQPSFRRWAPTTMDVRSSARRMREKLAELALERTQRQTTASGQEGSATATIAASCDLDPFASVATSGFDFAKSLDTTDGAGSVGVMVESDSFSTTRFGATNPNAYATWQMQRQQHTSSPTRTTELATLGLLARLPGEIRNRIYRLILLAIPPTPYNYALTPQTCSLGACTHACLPTSVPGILSTCRQIRSEGLPIFVAENIGFHFASRLVAARCVANWLRALGTHAASIRTLELEVHVYERDGGRGAGTRMVVLTRSPCLPLTGPLAGREGLRGDRLQADKIEVEIAKQIRNKAGEQCKRIKGHVEELNGRLMSGGGLRVEEAMYEVVGSDLMADLVWKCGK